MRQPRFVISISLPTGRVFVKEIIDRRKRNLGVSITLCNEIGLALFLTERKANDWRLFLGDQYEVEPLHINQQ